MGFRRILRFPIAHHSFLRVPLNAGFEQLAVIELRFSVLITLWKHRDPLTLPEMGEQSEVWESIVLALGSWMPM